MAGELPAPSFRSSLRETAGRVELGNTQLAACSIERLCEFLLLNFPCDSMGGAAWFYCLTSCANEQGAQQKRSSFVDTPVLHMAPKKSPPFVEECFVWGLVEPCWRAFGGLCLDSVASCRGGLLEPQHLPASQGSSCARRKIRHVDGRRIRRRPPLGRGQARGAFSKWVFPLFGCLKGNVRGSPKNKTTRIEPPFFVKKEAKRKPCWGGSQFFGVP